MPILPREIDLFPPQLFAGVVDDAALVSAQGMPAKEILLPDEGSPDRHWWALYTLSRREKELMRQLLRQQIPYYSPLIKRRTKSPGGRVRESFVPLFAGYVFLFGNTEERTAALKTNCVSRTLEIADEAELLRDLAQIHRLIDCDAPLSPEARLEPGMKVRVRSGPLMGTEGTIIQRRGQDRLLVAVKFLQQGVSISLEDYQVEKI